MSWRADVIRGQRPRARGGCSRRIQRARPRWPRPALLGRVGV